MFTLSPKCIIQDMKHIFCQLGIDQIKFLVVEEDLAEEGEKVSHLERLGLKGEYLDDQASELEDGLFNLWTTSVVVNSAFLILFSQENQNLL